MVDEEVHMCGQCLVTAATAAGLQYFSSGIFPTATYVPTIALVKVLSWGDGWSLCMHAAVQLLRLLSWRPAGFCLSPSSTYLMIRQ
jgi:hypothetical protein